MFNQSLNAGLDFDADLEVVPLIVETVGTGVAPEFEEEMQDVFSMESRVEDLLVLRREILQQSGMSQTLALEGLRILPDFGEKAPIGYYSVQPSSTRLKVSLESISKGIWALIIAGIAAVMALIYKIFKWLSPGKDESDPAKSTGAELERQAKHSEEMVETLRKSTAAVDKARQAFQDHPLRMDPESDYASGHNSGAFTMQKVIDTFFMHEARHQRVMLFLGQRDPIFHDIVNHGDYSKEMAQAAPLFQGLSVVMQQRMEILREIAERDLKKPGFAVDKLINVAALKPLLLHMEVNYQGHSATISKVTSEIANVRALAEAKKPQEDLVFDKLFSTIQQAFEKAHISRLLLEMRAVVPIMGKMHGYLDEMQQAAHRLSVDGAAGAHSETVGTDLRHAIFVLGKDLADLGVLMGQVQYYARHMSYLAVQAIAFGEEVAQKIVTHLRDDERKPPAAWVAVLAELKSYRSRLQELR
jgi:hypothetical protein